MLVTFIRHAEQYRNGSIDPHIKPGVFAVNVTYDNIISSPYLRCRETAAAVNTAQKPTYIDVRLSEYQTQPHRNNKLDPSTLQWGPVPVKETWEECAARIDAFYDYVREFSKIYGNTLVVTHGVVVNYLHEKTTGTKLAARGRNVPFVGGFTLNVV